MQSSMKELKYSTIALRDCLKTLTGGDPNNKNVKNSKSRLKKLRKKLISQTSPETNLEKAHTREATASNALSMSLSRLNKSS